MADKKSGVEIGYLEDAEPWKLESRFFPSKVGGKPAWLDMKNINIDTNCGRCSKPCVFLCQLYAPLTDKPEAYHRALYVFVCRDPDCCNRNDNRNFIVYRCQLSRANDFYSPDEPEDREDWCRGARIENHSRICCVCGCHAPNQCGSCKRVKYCSRDHQLLDWKSGHKVKCGNSDESSAEILFPEREIVNESEIIDDEDEELLRKPIEKSEEEKWRDYRDYLKNFKAGTMSHVDSGAMEEYAYGKVDKCFKAFKERLKICPDQVLRYDRGGIPLWISESRPDSVPRCELCHGPRKFEFQILPTLLNSMNVDSVEKSIDWGTLLVYTCEESCSGEPSYKKEFLYKQDPDE